MKSNIYDSERLNQYLQRIEAAREHRNTAVVGLIEGLQQLHDDMHRMETRIYQLIASVSDQEKHRPRARYRFYCAWERTTSTTSESIYFQGPYWHRVAKAPESVPERLKRRPTKRDIERAYKAEWGAEILSLAETLESLRTDYQRACRVLQRCWKALRSFEDMAGDIAGHFEKNDQAPKKIDCSSHTHAVIYRQRSNRIASMTALISGMLEEIQRIEMEVDEDIFQINRQGRRRNNVITAKWIVPSAETGTLSATKGPYWYVTRIGARGRFLEKIKRPTRSIIRKCYQRRYEQELLKYRDRIEHNAERRKKLNAALALIKRALSTVSDISTER